jgi:hypothetical protein
VYDKGKNEQGKKVRKLIWKSKIDGRGFLVEKSHKVEKLQEGDRKE